MPHHSSLHPGLRAHVVCHVLCVVPARAQPSLFIRDPVTKSSPCPSSVRVPAWVSPCSPAGHCVVPAAQLWQPGAASRWRACPLGGGERQAGLPCGIGRAQPTGSPFPGLSAQGAWPFPGLCSPFLLDTPTSAWWLAGEWAPLCEKGLCGKPRARAGSVHGNPLVLFRVAWGGALEEGPRAGDKSGDGTLAGGGAWRHWGFAAPPPAECWAGFGSRGPDRRCVGVEPHLPECCPPSQKGMCGPLGSGRGAGGPCHKP